MSDGFGMGWRALSLIAIGMAAATAGMALAAFPPSHLAGGGSRSPTLDAAHAGATGPASAMPHRSAKGDKLAWQSSLDGLLDPTPFQSLSRASDPEPEQSSQPVADAKERRRIVLGPEDLATPVAPAAGKHMAPIPPATLALMAEKDTSAAAPILIRSYKKEAELEVWKQQKSGRFVLLKVFPICRWSGQLGPKTTEGDRQTPEGFYSIRPAQMNPNSSYYLSFDLGYPNAFDKAHGATGAALMVHGTCSSRGCYAMTDKGVAEIYALAREAFAGGQKGIQFQAYPFRMTAENMVRYRADQHIDFWRQLKEGSDRFEALGEELQPYVDGGRYAFKPSASPAKEAQVTTRRAAENARIAALTAQGRPAIRTTYSDGGQHMAFRTLTRRGYSLGNVSRPEALAFAPEETVVIGRQAGSRTAQAQPRTP